MSEQNKPSLLIVDDDPIITDTLSYALSEDFEVTTSESRQDAIATVRAGSLAPQLALIDLGLPPLPHDPGEGFALIGELMAHSPAIKIIVLSGQGEAEHARHARSLGAVEFVPKPCDPDVLREVLWQTLKFRAVELSSNEGPAAPELIGTSPPITRLRSQVQQYADFPFPALIEGESGSGKELVAQLLHRLSSRRGKPMLALNCAAISPTLVEPTLFGYVKGAFTGAGSNKSGYFEDAADGTLFLDEIGELPLELQAKLLRVLENGEFQRVGETVQRHSRARVITATNRDLRQEVRKGSFRADLYHRLSVFTISVPALRDLAEDKLALLEHFSAFYAEQARVPCFSLSEEARALWQSYPFPGNVRELRNIVIRLSTKHAGRKISAADLEAELDLTPGAPTAATEAPTLTDDPDLLIEQAQRHLQRERGFSLDLMLKSWEQGYVEAAMKLTRGNVSQAAKLLGINRTTLYSRMESFQKEEFSR